MQRHERLKNRQAPLRVGEIVLVQDLPTVRYNWPLGRILEVYPDPKGVVRTVKVLCKGEEYLRSVSRVVRLELDSEEPDNQVGEGPAVYERASTPIDEEAREESVVTETSMGEPEAETVDEPDDLDESPQRRSTMPARPVRQAALRQ